MNIKALVLISGGLDSALAVKLIAEQGIEVEAINFHTSFCACGEENGKCPELGIRALIKELNVKLHSAEVSEEFINEVVINPKHGYGANMNPCIDCRIFILKKSKKLMDEFKASFLVTGEVLGQRPMSQQLHQMKIIDKEAEVEGIVLRPLSAKLLTPTIAEEKGWINREKLLGIYGRSRKEQLKLAKEKNITKFSAPAGGCLLTDAGFSNRLRDFIKFNGKPNVADVMLLKVGRQFRLSPDLKLVVGRNQAENKELESFKKDNMLLEAKDYAGPIGLLIGKHNSEEIKLASSIVARYSDSPKEQLIDVECKNETSQENQSLKVLPVKDSDFQKLRL